VPGYIKLDSVGMSTSWDDEYLTVQEIAEHLKLNQQTLRNWIFSPGVGVFPDAVGLQRW
jgi:hypothetical protein